jgi:hypothetical protein
VEGVQAAIQAEDYATAAGHVHRYLQFDKELLASEASAVDAGAFVRGLVGCNGPSHPARRR